jgi:hypothetical protein
VLLAVKGVIGIRTVVPPLAFNESEIRFPTAAAAVAVVVEVNPLGVTTLPEASFPLGSAQLIPRKEFVFVSRLLGEVEPGLVCVFSETVSFLEQPANNTRQQIT